MAEIGETALTLFVPLVISLVLQFSSFARELTNTDSTSLTDAKPLVSPVFGPWMPMLGRINFVHTTNNLLLLGGFILVAGFTGSNALQSVLAVLLVVVWLQLPILEVGQYTKIRQHNLPRSLYFHGVSTLTVVVYVLWQFEPGKILEEFDLLSPDFAQLVTSNNLSDIGVLGTLIVVGTFGFLKLLESELDRVTEASNSDLQTDGEPAK